MRHRPTLSGAPRRYRFVAATALVLALAIGGTALAGPKVVVEQTGVDLGEVSRGTVVEATFEVRNGGDEVLRILRVKPG